MICVSAVHQCHILGDAQIYWWQSGSHIGMLLKLDPRPKVRNVKEEKQDAAQTQMVAPLISLLLATIYIHIHRFTCTYLSQLRHYTR